MTSLTLRRTPVREGAKRKAKRAKNKMGQVGRNVILGHLPALTPIPPTPDTSPSQRIEIANG